MKEQHPFDGSLVFETVQRQIHLEICEWKKGHAFISIIQGEKHKALHSEGIRELFTFFTSQEFLR